MNNIEFSNLFDVLWNNINSNEAPGLNEYEKSVFLTKALDEILKNYFNPKSNPKLEGYDDTIKRQADFSGLMREEAGTIEDNPTSQFDPRSIVYKVPTDVYLIINELLLLKENNSVKGIRQILPINYDEYRRVMSKPYKEPLKYQAWRLFTSTESNSFNGKRIAEIILTNPDKKSSYVKEYRIRYIKFPKPIILSNFSGSFGENISINGYNGSELEYSKREETNPKYEALRLYKYTTEYHDGFVEFAGDYLDGITDPDEAIELTRQKEEEYNAYLVQLYPDLYSTDPVIYTYVDTWDPCELDPVIHEEILQRAVEIAKVAWLGDANTIIQTGQRSE